MLIKRISGATRALGAPADWDGKDMSCSVLPVLDVQTAEGNFMFSAWEPTPPELEALNKGANIILGVRGTLHPVVSVQVAADIAPAEKHPDDIAVDQFAEAMKAKLADARAKGRSGWQECDTAELSYMLREHVEKGDPRDVANFCMFLWSLGKPIGDARPVVGLQLTPLDGIQVWIDAYTNAPNGPHFMGHGLTAHLLREYLALRKLLAQRTPPPLPETHYNGSGDGSEPLYTADMLHLYASQYAASLALPVKPAPTDDQVKSAIRELDECQAFDDNGVTDEAVAIIRKMFTPFPVADKRVDPQVRLEKYACHQCGLPVSENPHPDAGKPNRLLEVNTQNVCIPCLTLNRHQWAQRAIKAERDTKRLDMFEKNGRLSMELQHPDPEEPGVWTVLEENGGWNDREWSVAGTGATVRDAIDAALAAAFLPAKEGGKL